MKSRWLCSRKAAVWFPIFTAEMHDYVMSFVSSTQLTSGKHVMAFFFLIEKKNVRVNNTHALLRVKGNITNKYGYSSRVLTVIKVIICEN